MCQRVQQRARCTSKPRSILLRQGLRSSPPHMGSWPSDDMTWRNPLANKESGLKKNDGLFYDYCIFFPLLLVFSQRFSWELYDSMVQGDQVHSVWVIFINVIKKLVHTHYKISEKYRQAERRLKIPIFLLSKNHFTVFLSGPYSTIPSFNDIFGINDWAPMIKNNGSLIFWRSRTFYMIS